MLLALRRHALAISMRRTWPDGAKQATGTPRPSAKNGKLLTPFAREHCKLTTATSPRWGAIEWLRRSAAAAPGAEPFTYLLLASAYALNGRQAEAQDELKRYLSLSRNKSTTIPQLRKQQLSLADNSTWVAYNERLFE